MRETQREREREKMLVFSLLSSPLVSGSFLFVFLVPFYSLGLLLGVTVFLLWREWWQQLVYAKWSSPPTLQRETFLRFEFLMFLIIFEDHHHHHHAHAIDQDSIATILYQSKLQALPILFVRSGDKTFPTLRTKCITYIDPLLMNRNQQSVQESKLQIWASNWDQTDSKPWPSHCLILDSEISSFRNLHIAASWKQRKTLVNTSFCISYMISQNTYFRLWMTQPAIQAKQ